jgi:hypothetical protein
LSEPAARVAEFVRQWSLNSRDRGDEIYGVQFDPAIDAMAQLYASDLRAILEELREGDGA